MIDYLLLKASLLTEGIRAEAECLREVGTRYKEQNHGLFGWDFENHQQMKAPDDVGLEDGSVVQFRLNSRSPYIVRQDPRGPGCTATRSRSATSISFRVPPTMRSGLPAAMR